MKKLSTLNSQFSIPKGFTLIELLVVIAIIGILATLITASFQNVRQKGRDGNRKSNLRQIQSALELYRADVGFYPSDLINCPTAQFPARFGNSPTCDVTYMQTIPVDPVDGISYSYGPEDCTGINCLRYTIFACLENVNDPEKANPNQCDSPRVSYQLTNP